MYYLIRDYVGRSPHHRILVDALILVLAGVFGWVTWAGSTAADKAFRKADKAACVRIEMLKTGFRGSLQRALVSLPAISYYKAHPQELAIQVKQIKDQIKEYAPSKC